MFKYVAMFIIISSFNAQARYQPVPSGSALSYDSKDTFYMNRSFKTTTGKDGQMSIDDYKKSVDSLPRNEQRWFEDTIESDFATMDYNKDGLVSRDEYQRFNLLKEQSRKKTKNEERIIKKQKRKNTYVDPSVEINAITTKLDEEIKKKQEEAQKKAAEND